MDMNTNSKESHNNPGRFALRYNTLSIATLVFIIASALAFAFAFYRKAPAEPVREALGWETMRIDGDRDGFYVEFSHKTHSTMPGEGCVYCHHLSIPGDSVTSCFRCHRDMKKPVSIFDHERHATHYKTKGKHCGECHGKKRAREYVRRCNECHKEYDRSLEYYLSARNYESAMHDRCMPCHREQDNKIGEKMYNDCGFCHSELPAR